MSVRGDNAKWAREVLADPRTAVLDTETTGLYGYACEISVFDGQAMLLDTLVNPQAVIEAGAARVHGLTKEKLHDAPLSGDLLGQLVPILADRRIVVWNAEFDAKVIRREYSRLGQECPELLWECAMIRYSDWLFDMDDARYQRLSGGHRAARCSTGCAKWPMNEKSRRDPLARTPSRRRRSWATWVIGSIAETPARHIDNRRRCGSAAPTTEDATAGRTLGRAYLHPRYEGAPGLSPFRPFKGDRPTRITE